MQKRYFFPSHLPPLSTAMQKRYFFMCNDWLKGACERKLEVGKVCRPDAMLEKGEAEGGHERWP